MGAASATPDFHRATSFQELTRLVDGLDLERVLDQPVSVFLASLSAGAARAAVEEMSRTGELRTFRDALRNAHLRAEVRWRGGRPGESQLLRALQDFLSSARAFEPPPLAPPPPEPEAPEARASGLHLGMSAEDLEVWAAAHGIGGLLELTDLHLSHVLEGRARYWLTASGSGRSVRELLAGGAGRGEPLKRWTRGLSPEIQESLLAFLEAAAERVAAGLHEEAERALHEQRPPSEAGLAEVWESLVEERARLRALSSPPPRAVREGWSLQVSEDPPLVSVQTSGYALCGRTPAPRVQVALQRAGDAPATACTCRHAEASCPLKLAAVDLCLETLRDPASLTQARAMARARGRPAWERFVGRLDPMLGEPELRDRGGNPVELGWRLRWRARDATLDPVGCRPRKSGKGVALARIELSQLRAQPGLLALPADARAAILLSPDPATRNSATFTENARILRAMLELVGHPRVYFGEPGEPVSVRRETLTLCWTLLEDGGLSLDFSVGDTRWSAGELLTRHREDGAGDLLFARQGGALILLELPLYARTLVKELHERGERFPPEATAQLLRRVSGISRLIPCHLDPTLRGAELPWELRPLVYLEIEPGGGLLVEVQVRPLPEGPAWPPGEGPDELYGIRPEGRIYVRRDLGSESARVRTILASVPLPPEAESGHHQWLLLSPEVSLLALEALQALGEAVSVVWRGERRRKVGARPEIGQLGVSVSARRDWLGLSGNLVLDGGSVPLERLLAAIRAGSTYVDVDGETWVRLTDTLREALEPLATATQDTRSGTQLSALHAQLLETLEDAGAPIDGEAGWRDLVERVRAADAMDLSPPPGLRASLRDYQRQGYAWMARLASWSPGACLADDMGLGKTVQALALLLSRASQGPALVVAPTSVCFNWAREAARFAPSLRVRAWRGPNRQALLEDLAPGDVLVASYDVVARDAEVLAPLRLGTLILDEAQAIKNPHTRRARAIFGLDAAFRLALTGTPVENRLSELWSLFRAVAPSLLGGWERFRDRFVTPIERDDDRDRRRALSRLIRPFLLRRLKREVATELPSRTDVQLDVTLSRDERVLYDNLRKQALQELGAAPGATEAQQRMRVLAALTRLRQAACHPRLVAPELGLPSSKVERLREILVELREEGHRVLIFSQFVRLLTLVREALEPEGIRFRWLDGATPEARRREEVDAFQRGEGDAFLISLKAGGTGLNLTAANYVIHLDPWWNPAVEDQATDRAHRIGQDQPVTVIRLVARGTLEETILGMHAEKRALAADLLEGTGQAALPADELLALLADSGEPEGDEETARADADEALPDEAADDLVPDDPEPQGDLDDAPLSLDQRLIEFEAFLGEEVAEQRLVRRLASQYLSAMSEFVNWLIGAGHGDAKLEDLERHGVAFQRAAMRRPLPRQRRVVEVFPRALSAFVSYGQAVGWA